MLRKRWVKWTLVFLGILLVAAGTARSIRVKRSLATLARLEAQMPAAVDPAGQHHHDHDAMPNMEAHMKWTAARPVTASDEARAAQIVAVLNPALEPYRDYKAAVRAGYFPFHPEVAQRMVHFTNNAVAIRNAFTFDAARPTSLLYRKGERGYELIGAMYTAPRGMSEARLDERVPLSIGRWHQHVNICLPARDQAAGADWTRFGPAGSITTEAQCAAAGGRWYPTLFGWMIHVYPNETTREKIWTH
jgi:hypothetical protein